MSFTFSSQLVAAFCQKSTASARHCHRAPAQVESFERPASRGRRIGAPQEIPPSLTHNTTHTHTHTPPQVTPPSINSIHLKRTNIVYISKTFMGYSASVINCNFFYLQAFHGDRQWPSHALQQPVARRSVISLVGKHHSAQCTIHCSSILLCLDGDVQNCPCVKISHLSWGLFFWLFVSSCQTDAGRTSTNIRAHTCNQQSSPPLRTWYRREVNANIFMFDCSCRAC